MLINRGSFHGNDLVIALEGPDNTWYAERLLAQAELDGLIERGSFAPAREQRFFGVGGLEGHRLTERHGSLVCYHWITKTTRWL